MKTIFASFILSLLTISHGLAADIYIDNDATKNHFLHLRGEIVKGDYDKIVSLIKRGPDEFLKYDWQLDSNGGDILEAMKIGNFVKDLYQRVNVADQENRNAKCASACFFIYISAVSRNAVSGSIGVHRPYFAPAYFANLSPQEAEKKYSQLSKSVRDFLTDKEVPGTLIEKMFSLASNEIYWLDNSALETIGDRPPWFDQYLLSRCGFTSRMFLNAVDRHEVDQATAWARCESVVLLSQGLAASSKYLANK